MTLANDAVAPRFSVFLNGKRPMVSPGAWNRVTVRKRPTLRLPIDEKPTASAEKPGAMRFRSGGPCSPNGALLPPGLTG